MENDIIFILNDNLKLYLEKELCTFDFIPCLFLCKDNKNNKYLVYNPDCRYNDEYIIVKLSESEEFNLINKNTTIYDTIKNHNMFWLVKPIDDDPFHDNVIYNSTDSIDDSILPDKDAYLKIISY